ncbi:hypothetical protein PESP_b0779 [Pseudoalteromonas espejiana DSM 9414]|nr:hypothetical protein PESP_b0779 [Pseudoalteromonas espejiana DSM 9414]
MANVLNIVIVNIFISIPYKIVNKPAKKKRLSPFFKIN